MEDAILCIAVFLKRDCSTQIACAPPASAGYTCRFADGLANSATTPDVVGEPSRCTQKGTIWCTSSAACVPTPNIPAAASSINSCNANKQYAVVIDTKPPVTCTPKPGAGKDLLLPLVTAFAQTN